MKTYSIPHPRPLFVIGRVLLVAGSLASATVPAQQIAPPPPPAPPPTTVLPERAEAPPQATPAPVAPRLATPGPALAAPPSVEPPPVGLPAAPRIEPAPGGAPGRGSAGASSGEARPGREIAPPGAGTRRVQRVARVALDEEVSADPQDAAREYQAIIAEFDRQRESAAQAVFRLGESYRRLGRLEEARVQYARVLREFVDFPELARLSQQQLAQNAPREGRIAATATAAPAPSAEERNLLNDELRLLEEQLRRMEELVENGNASTESLFQTQRELLHLKQQLARLPAVGETAPAGSAAAPAPSGALPGSPAPIRTTPAAK